MFQGPKLGEILVAAGVIDEIQLVNALAEQQSYGGRLGTTLLRSGALDERALVAALAAQLKLPVAHLEGKKIRADMIGLLPADKAVFHMCIPLFVKEERGGKVLYLGMEDPCDLEIQDALAFRTGFRIRPVMVPPSELLTALERAYGIRIHIGADARGKPAPTELAEPPDYVARGPDVETAEIEGFEPEPRGLAERGGTSPVGPASTREILRALTQILTETQVVDREQLHARVRLLQEAESPDLG